MTNFNKVETIENISETERHIARVLDGIFSIEYDCSAYKVVEYTLGKDSNQELFVKNDKEFKYLSELFIGSNPTLDLQKKYSEIDELFKKFQISQLI